MNTATVETPHQTEEQQRRAPRLRVGQSTVHGRGVYADEFIAEGTRIIEYTGQRILWASVEDDPDDPRTYYFAVGDGSIVIDPSVDGNEARWINHSCDPNCEAIEEDGDRMWIYALRDIQPGEELFYDYRLTVDERNKEAEEENACRCGAENCRGNMLDPDEAKPSNATDTAPASE
jgi:hypothetical protein